MKKNLKIFILLQKKETKFTPLVIIKLYNQYTVLQLIDTLTLQMQNLLSHY